MQTPAFVATKTVGTWKLFRGLIWVAAGMAACLCPLTTLAQCNTVWQGGARGDWSVASNWTNGVPADNNTCVSPGSSAITLDVNGTTNNFTLSSTDSLAVENGLSLTLSGNGIFNSGTIHLLSSGSPTSLVFNGEDTLFGAGKIILSNNSQNLISGSGILTNFNTIEGAGNVGSGQLSIENRGTISANGPAGSTLTIDGGGSIGFRNECKCDGNQPNGILAVSHGDTLNITGNFTNFSDGAISDGIYNVTGTLEFAAGTTGIVSLSGATINLIGPTAKILNTSEGNSNALSGLNEVAGTGGDTGGLGLAGGAQFTTGGNFTNDGTLTIGNGSKFSVGTNGAFELGDFSSSTSTLNAGAFVLTGTGQVQFNNGGDSLDIVSSGGSITLAGASTTSSLIDQNGNSALANFANNLQFASFTLTTGRTFTTGGSFTNAGTLSIQKASGTQLIIGGGGSYSQTGGTTTLDGKLTASGGINISGGHVYGNNGTFTGNFDLTGGTLNPGDGIDRMGVLNIAGNYTESGAGVLNIDVNGSSSTPTFDVLNITGTANLGGTLTVNVLVTVGAGQTFDIMNYTSETGTFTTLNLPKLKGGDTWSISYNAKDVVLTVDGPAAAPANLGLVSGVPAKRVSRGLMAGTSADGAREPVAILSRAGCFAARMLMASAAACGSERMTTVASGGERRATATAGIGSGVVHNNIMVATRSISGERGGAVGRESSASATAMARLYVCAYFPSSVAHSMGCN